MSKISIYLISDSVGETAQKIVAAVAAQFPSLHPFDVRRYPFIADEDTLIEIFDEAKKEGGIVVHTMVTKKLIKFTEDYCKEIGLLYVDFMSPLVSAITKQTGIESQEEPGTLRRLDRDYFNRVEAIEFAVKYDDGKDARGFELADIVLLGISRTSKTPLSMYLANRGIKVANLPLIPEIPLAKEIFKIPKDKLIALTSGLSNISRIRKSRLRALGLKDDNSYSNIKRIQAELDYSHMVFEELGLTAIDVENRAIEEVAAIIEARVGGGRLNGKIG